MAKTERFFSVIRLKSHLIKDWIDISMDKHNTYNLVLYVLQTILDWIPIGFLC